MKVTDQGGLFFEKVFPVQVVDVNEPPIQVTLSNNTVSDFIRYFFFSFIRLFINIAEYCIINCTFCYIVNSYQLPICFFINSSMRKYLSFITANKC